MKKLYRVTAQGVDDLRNELEELVANRGAVAERIKTAREFGDLSENAEYSAARQEQEKSESRIAVIENILENHEIIAEPKKGDSIQIGNTVELKNTDGTRTFTIVGSVEANPTEGKISDESPIGMALLGKKLGEDVEIVTPAKSATFKIAKIA